MVPNSGKQSKDQDITEVSHQIAKVLSGIRFGSVEIIIHESKVVQIERKEKIRFEEKR
jgi:hypothetical protein